MDKNYIIDSHCHLHLSPLNERMDEVVENAHKNNVKYLLNIATMLSDYENVIKIAEKYENVFCTIGVHPNEVENNLELSTDSLIKMASHAKLVGFGETGLDYYHDRGDRKLQREGFVKHIDAARELDLPVIIHTRNADEDTIELLKSEYKNGPFKGLIHCFTAGKELANKACDLGMSISISGIITFQNAASLQEIVKDIPLEFLLIETDAPYLAPVPYRGKPNEPAFVKHTAAKLAELKGIKTEEVICATTENFLKLFNKVDLSLKNAI